MQEPVALVGAAIAGVAILAIVVYFYRRKKEPEKFPGKNKNRHSGAAAAVNLLRRFAQSNRFGFFAPATVEAGGKRAELDAVVVGYFGVLGIIAIGYNGEVYGSASEPTWVRVAKTGQRTSFANPLTEAAAAVRVLRDVLMKTKQRKAPVSVLCVFTSPDAQLALPRNTGHYTMKELRAHMRKEKYMEDCGLDLEAVKTALGNAVVR